MSQQLKSVRQLEQALKELKEARHLLHHKRMKSAENEIADSLKFLGKALRTIQQEFGVTTTTFNATGSLQTFTAPSDGTVIIQAIGAAGGGVGIGNIGGRGASIQGQMIVVRSETLAILVGSAGMNGDPFFKTFGGGGGGGGSFVWIGTTFTDLTSETLLIAAGGGGGSSADTTGIDAVITQGGTSSSDGTPGGSDGNGGGGGLNSNVEPNDTGAGGGAGVFSSGGFGHNEGSAVEIGGAGGSGIRFSGRGGQGDKISSVQSSGGNGGFGGGGGGGVGASAGGGGGGFSGGGGASPSGSGGGGSSLNNGALQTNTASVGNGNGLVTITFVPCRITLSITKPSPLTYELQGTVTVSGAPAEGVTVTFTPFAGPFNLLSIAPNPAVTDASGNFASTMTFSSVEPKVFGTIFVEASTAFNGITVATRQFATSPG
ncbi:hypothetical protein [Cohnella sp. REN36]|uniref:hypothetical protein n=1 Tax=Cohnella sp. REN36 TaxID=2887347 RepID=UPI001D15941E|nr:hypothetical protein [Cohnella sp. REN36]MCC3372610.1 hypothetical protein [Cohnella sp. REN36]